MSLLRHLILASLVSGLHLHARDLPGRVTVAHRMEADLNDLGSSLTFFNRDEIELMGGLFLQDVLRWAPGVNITRSGGPGQDSRIYLRGTEPRHSLVLIDGIEMRNPNSPDGFDIVHFPVGDIDRIEVLRGPQSPFYGADALGGVLNIVSRKSSDIPAGAIEISVGSHDTMAGSFSTSGRKGGLSYSMHGMLFKSNSFSVASNGTENDPYQNHSAALTLDYELSGLTDLQFKARYLDGETYFDNAATSDALDFLSCQEDSLYQLGLVRKGEDGQPLVRAAVSYKDFQRNNFSFSTEHFSSKAWKVELQRTLTIGDNLRILAGIEYLEEKGQQDLNYGFGSTIIRDTLCTASAFAQVRKALSREFTMDFGCRLDDSRHREAHSTWRAAGNYRVTRTARLKGSVGTGFYAPNVYYLAHAQDRATLLPEECLGFDIGLEQQFADGQAILAITWFKNHIENQMNWNAAYKVINLNEVETHGMETSLAWTIGQDWKLLFDWTHLHARNLSTGWQLDFRPEDQLAMRLFWTPAGKKYRVFVGLRHRTVFWNVYTDPDTWRTFDNSEMNPSPAGMTGEVSIRYRLGQTAALFLRAEDVFNQKLEEMRDYNGNPYAVSGRSFRAGINWSF